MKGSLFILLCLTILIHTVSCDYIIDTFEASAYVANDNRTYRFADIFNCNPPRDLFSVNAVPNLRQYIQNVQVGNSTVQIFPDAYCSNTYRIPSVFGGYRKITIHTETANAPYTPTTGSGIVVGSGYLILNVGADLPVSLQLQYNGGRNASYANCQYPYVILCNQTVTDLGPYIQPGIDITEGGRDQAFALTAHADHPGTIFQITVISSTGVRGVAEVTQQSKKRSLDGSTYEYENGEVDGIMMKVVPISEVDRSRIAKISGRATVSNAVQYVIPFSRFPRTIDFTSISTIVVTILRQVALDAQILDLRTIPLVSQTKTGVVVDSVVSDNIANPGERVNFSIRVSVIPNAVDVSNILFYDNPYLYDNLGTFDPTSVTATGFNYYALNCTNATAGSCGSFYVQDNFAFNGSFVTFANGSLVYPNAIAFFIPRITTGSYIVFNYSIVINPLACAQPQCPSGCLINNQQQYSTGPCICTRNTGYVCLSETNPQNTILQLGQLINGTLSSNFTTALNQRCSPTTDTTTQTTVTSVPVGAIPNPAVVVRANPTDKANGLLPCASTTFTITLYNNRSRSSDAFTLRVSSDANLVCSVGSGTSNPTFSLDSAQRYSRVFASGLIYNAAPLAIPFTCNVSCSLGCNVNNTVLTATIDFGSNTQNCAEDITADDTSSDNVPLIGAPSLTVSKSNAASITLSGTTNQLASFTITVANTGTRAATNVVVVDTIPSALASVYQSGDNNAWTSQGNNQYAYTIPSIDANSQVQLAFNYRIPSTASDCVLNSYPNQVAVSGTCGGSATANATVSFVAVPDIAVSIGTPVVTPSATNPAPNSLVCYPITYQNIGYRVASSVVLSVTLPSFTTFNAQSSASGFTRNGNNYQLTVSSVAAQSTATVQFCVNVNANLACGSSFNTNVTVTAVCPGFPETNFGNNQAVSASLTAASSVILSLTKTAFNAAGNQITSATPGQTVTYRLSGINSGTSQSTGVTLTETLPAGLTVGTITGWSLTGSNTYTYSVGTVNAGASFGPVSFSVVVPSSVNCPSASITNVATVTEGCVGATVTANLTLPVVAAPVLNLTASTTQTVTLANGNQVCVTACYANTGNQVAANSSMTVTIPQYATYVTSTGYTLSGSTLTYNIGNIAVGANVCANPACFTITSPIPCGVNNVTFNFALTSPCYNGAALTAATLVNIVASPSYVITKSNSLGGTDARPGQLVTYTIAYSNIGYRNADDAVLTENIPTYMTVPANSNPGWTCSATTCTRTIGQLSRTQGTQNVTIVMQVSNNIPGRVTVNNTASIASFRCPAQAPAISLITVAGFPNLRIVKTDFDIVVMPGGYIYYTITYSNVGDTSADQVVINETVPSFTTFDRNLSAPGWSCSNGAGAGVQCVYTVGVLNRGASGNVRFVVKVDDWVRCGVDTIYNFVSIQSLNPSVTETDYTDNSAVESTPLEGQPDLVIEKVTNRTLGARYERAGAGDLIVYNITYSNVGLRDAVDAVIYETVPEYTQFDASASSSSWSCAGVDAGSVCTFTLEPSYYPTMPGMMGSERMIQFAVRVVSDLPPWAHVTTNCVYINNTCGDCNMFNNMACYPVTLYGVPDLVINQTAYCASIHWFVEWSNVGDQAASNVQITDTIPAQTVFDASRSDSRWSCNTQAGTATFGQCTINVGTLNSGAGGSAIFVTTPISGTTATEFMNTASATGTGNNNDPTPDNNVDTAMVGFEGCPDSCDSCCPTVDECCPDKTEVVFQFGGLLNGIDKCNSS